MSPESDLTENSESSQRENSERHRHVPVSRSKSQSQDPNQQCAGKPVLQSFTNK